MGSRDSFLKFPSDLKTKLEDNNLKVDIAFYEYETKGNNQRQVQKLMDFLILHGNSVSYKKVILLAHSMGGILAIDAYLNLYQVEESGYFSYGRTVNHSSEDMRFLTRIKGILTFDSPFFGLHRNVFLKSGMEKAAQVAKSAPEIISTQVDVRNIIPDTIPLHVKGFAFPVSTKWLKEQGSSSELEKEIISNHSKVCLEDEKTESFNWNWNKLAGFGAIAASALNAFGFAGPLISSMATSNLDLMESYSTFLSPLITTSDRINVIIKEHKEKRVYFRAFYNVVGIEGHFCNPSDSKDHHEHFEVLQSPISDEIDAHMFMFCVKSLGEEKYNSMILNLYERISHLICCDL
jgi:hypothetical protein